MADALALPCARPFYPDYQHNVVVNGERALSWPALSGWPTSPTETARKNAAHLAIPGANPYHVDTRENVYADVASDRDTEVVGEDPQAQVETFIQVVDARSVAHLLKVLKAWTWAHGDADDVFFAVSLHLSEERLAKLLGCKIGAVRLWFDQARMSIFKEHVQAPVGRGMSVSEQDNVWRNIVQAFKDRHVAEHGGEWKQLSCCEDGRIEEAFAEAFAEAEATNVESSHT
jgi:hypothetical protein